MITAAAKTIKAEDLFTLWGYNPYYLYIEYGLSV